MEKFINHIQLGYLGLLPFLGCVGWPLIAGSSAVNLEFFTFYSIAILAFMAGNLWHAGQQSHADAIKAIIPILPIGFKLFTNTMGFRLVSSKFLACIIIRENFTAVAKLPC